MSGMKFAMVELALHDRTEWRALHNDLMARYAYLVIRTSTRLNYSGCYHYPLPLFSFEAGISEKDLPPIIDRLIQEGMIEYDYSSGWVRVVGWYYGVYSQENSSKVIKWSRLYLEGQFPNCDLATNSAAEFVVGSLRRAGNFHEDSKHAEAVYQVLHSFARNASQIFSGFPQALERELYHNGQSTWRHLRGRGSELSAVAKIEAAGRQQQVTCHAGTTLPAPYREGGDTMGPQREREPERKKEAHQSDARHLHVTLESALVKGMDLQ